MSGTAIGVTIAVVVIVIVVVAALAFVATRGRNGRLRRKYGPEFDRLAAERGDPRAAEQELAEREKEHRALTLHPLDAPERQRYTQAWSDAQAQFLDDPHGAAVKADRIIGEVLGEIGYPVQDRERQLALASVDHPRGLSEYRAGHDLVERNAGVRPAQDAARPDAAGTTEAMRQAMLHFQSFFDELLSDAHQHASR
jgi:hypothetical protein